MFTSCSLFAKNCKVRSACSISAWKKNKSSISYSQTFSILVTFLRQCLSLFLFAFFFQMEAMKEDLSLAFLPFAESRTSTNSSWIYPENRRSSFDSWNPTSGTKNAAQIRKGKCCRKSFVLPRTVLLLNSWNVGILIFRSSLASECFVSFLNALFCG